MADNKAWQDFLDELRQKNDIVSVVSRYCQIQRRGSSFWVRCPFHSGGHERTPSLQLNEIDNLYYCFGCHQGGNVINFVMNIEALEYMEAVQLLASWANMEVPQRTGKSDSEAIAKKKKEKERLLALAHEAAVFYRNNLRAPEAKVAWEYIKKRQLPNEIVTKFGLGYSLGFNQVVEHLYSKGYTREEMLKSGVCKEKDGRLFDAEATRLIFPIIDIYSNVIGFCGRTLESNPEFAKYLNTAETPIFNKGKTLYGINYLRAKKQAAQQINYVILCEGQMDVVSLHKAGFDTAVASMGTALTLDQAKLIKRFSDVVYICYDGDKAGKSATIRGLDILQDNNLIVKVVSLPEGLDPDDVIKTYGADGYQKCLDKALPLTEYKIAYIKKQHDMNTADGKAKFVNESLDLVAKMSDEIARELYLAIIAKHADMNKDLLKRELEKKVVSWQDQKQKLLDEANELEKQKITSDKEKLLALAGDYDTNNNDGLVAPEEEIKLKTFEKVDSNIDRAEKFMLCAMIHQKPYAYIKENIADLFGNNYREVYEYYYFNRESANENFVSNVYDHFAKSYGSAIVEIINYFGQTDDEEFDAQCFHDCLWILKKKQLENRQKELTAKLSSEVDENKRRDIIVELGQIVQDIKNKKVEF